MDFVYKKGACRLAHSLLNFHTVDYALYKRYF